MRRSCAIVCGVGLSEKLPGVDDAPLLESKRRRAAFCFSVPSGVARRLDRARPDAAGRGRRRPVPLHMASIRSFSARAGDGSASGLRKRIAGVFGHDRRLARRSAHAIC